MSSIFFIFNLELVIYEEEICSDRYVMLQLFGNTFKINAKISSNNKSELCFFLMDRIL